LTEAKSSRRDLTKKKMANGDY